MKFKALFFGLITIDLHFFTDHYPEENSKTKAKEFQTYVGGPATNAAITFNHLGGESSLWTCIGHHDFNGMMTEELGQRNIAIRDMVSGQSFKPIFASIVTNNISGDRTILSYNPPLVRTPLPEIPLGDFSIALFDGFYMPQAIEAAKRCRKLGITTIFDGGSWKKDTERLLKYIDIAICSADFHPPGIDRITEVPEAMIKLGPQKVAVTRGGKSVIYSEGKANYKIDIPRTNVKDTLGAGDIFHGAFCYHYLKSPNFVDSLKYAAEIATLSCKFEGPRAWMER